MKNDYYIVTGCCLTGDGKLCVANYYLGDLLEVDLDSNCIKTFRLDEEEVFLVYAIYSDGKRTIMYPRNGRKIYLVNNEAQQLETITLDEEISNYVFPIFYNNNILVFERKKKDIWLIDYNANIVKKILTYEEAHNFSNLMVYDDAVLLLSPDTNSMYIYSLEKNQGETIYFSDKIIGITKMYRFQEYFVGFNLQDNKINFFDCNGEKKMSFQTEFTQVQIEPYMYQKETDVLCFLGNTEGVAYEVNIKTRKIQKKELNLLHNQMTYYFNETEKFIYGIEMTFSYDRVLNHIFKINKLTHETQTYILNFADSEQQREYEAIKRYIGSNISARENTAINLKHFIKCI